MEAREPTGFHILPCIRLPERGIPTHCSGFLKFTHCKGNIWDIIKLPQSIVLFGLLRLLAYSLFTRLVPYLLTVGHLTYYPFGISCTYYLFGISLITGLAFHLLPFSILLINSLVPHFLPDQYLTYFLPVLFLTYLLLGRYLITGSDRVGT